MMEYGDEAIIRKRVALMAEKSHSINGKVLIDGTEYTFAPREFEYGFSMVVPESFNIMDDETAKRKFPREDRPEVIIANDNFRVCIAFICEAIPDGTLKERLKRYREASKKLHPSDVFFSETISETPRGLKIACYDYRYPAIDKDMYNLGFFTDLSDKELFGWFMCPVDMQDSWEPLARQMIKSIEDKENRDA